MGWLRTYRKSFAQQAKDERRLYRHNPSYRNFLRAIRRQPGFGAKVFAFLAFLAAAVSQHPREALTVAGLALLAVATLGYVFWRWRVTRF